MSFFQWPIPSLRISSMEDIADVTRILQITNGSQTIDLINGDNYELQSWVPKIPFYKTSLVYYDSPMTDDKQVAYKQFDNVTEEIVIGIKANSQAEFISALNNLLIMLDSAVDYFSVLRQQDFNLKPIYLKVQVDGEANPKYAVIINATVDGVSDIIHGSFVSGVNDGTFYASGMINITLSIERQHYISIIPGYGEAVTASNSVTYNGVDFGYSESSTATLYVANKYATANLTHIYVDDGGAFGSNLVNSTSFSFFPSTPATDDAIYFGVSSSVQNSGPISNLVFDIGTALVYDSGEGSPVTWEFYSSDTSDWASISSVFTGDARGFLYTGPCTMAWQPPYYQTSNTVNGVDGWWIRCRVNDSGLMPSYPPTQQNTKVYSATRSYITVDGSSLSGDLPSLLRARIGMDTKASQTLSSVFPYGTEYLHGADRMMMGLRSVNRGQNFIPHINLSDRQNPDGIEVSDYPSLLAAFTDDSYAPTGRSIVSSWLAPPGYSDIPIAGVIEMDDAINRDYFGDFRMFLRVQQYNGDSEDWKVRIDIQSGHYNYEGTIIHQTEVLYTQSPIRELPAGTDLATYQYELMDFGTVSIPGIELGNVSDIDLLTIAIRAEPTGTVTSELHLIDLILIPIDEWAGDFTVAGVTGDYEPGYFYRLNDILDINSISSIRKGLVVQMLDEATDNFLLAYTPISNGRFTAKPNHDQRLYLLGMDKFYADSGSVVYCASPSATYSVSIQSCDRYRMLRG